MLKNEHLFRTANRNARKGLTDPDPLTRMICSMYLDMGARDALALIESFPITLIGEPVVVDHDALLKGE